MPGADNGSGAVQLPSSANKFIFTKRLALNAVTVIPATFNHAAGEPGNDHSGPPLLRLTSSLTNKTIFASGIRKKQI
jgi:hypothetical protein